MKINQRTRLAILTANIVLAALTMLAGVVYAEEKRPTYQNFEWAAYDTALAAYLLSPDAEGSFEKELHRALNLRTGLYLSLLAITDVVAPGIHAELGHLYLTRGEIDKAIEHFQQEMAGFPESRHFMTRAIEAARSHRKVADK